MQKHRQGVDIEPEALEAAHKVSGRTVITTEHFADRIFSLNEDLRREYQYKGDQTSKSKQLVDTIVLRKLNLRSVAASMVKQVG